MPSTEKAANSAKTAASAKPVKTGDRFEAEPSASNSKSGAGPKADRAETGDGENARNIPKIVSRKNAGDKVSISATAPKDPQAEAAEKRQAARNTEEKDSHPARQNDTVALNPAAGVRAQARANPSAAPTTPAASEPIQVAKNNSEIAAKAAAPKSIQSTATAAPASAGAGAKATSPASKTPATAAKARPAGQKHGFKQSEFIVYPAHGVGQIIGIEVQEVAGFSLELFVVSFIKDKMILKVPTSKVASVGMRKLAEHEVVEKALSTLSGRARVKRTMWSRRAQEYEAKINSGDLVTIAEVVRDLYRSETQPEQSYSERQLYEAALDRMAREVAVVRKLLDAEALKLIEAFLLKGPRRNSKGDAEVIAEDDSDADVDRAA
jgi:CarD family transcriptional regulator